MYKNVPVNIREKIGANLLKIENHPLTIIKNKIVSILGESFKVFEDLNPVVTIVNNFDKLLIPMDHVSRSQSDSYYIDDKTLLRTHTSAHQCELLEQGERSFIVVGDVYRRDEIDCYHFPVFHQLEAVKIVSDGVDPVEDLKKTLNNLLSKLFKSENIKYTDSYFPFTEPSFEVEIEYNNKMIEVLGCGQIHSNILKSIFINEKGWAFGLGLERLAMILFNIPDIRYFWSKDPRFLNQFEKGLDTKFVIYSKYPECTKDISFWINQDFSANDFYEAVREICGDLIEDIKLKDTFSKNDRKSECYRLTYRHNDRSLTNTEVDQKQAELRTYVQQHLPITLR